MPIFEYNGNKVNVNDDQISEFAKYHPDAITKIERDGKVYGVRPGDMEAFNARFTNNQEGEQATQIYYQPQATDKTDNKDTGSFIGDIGERFLSGAASAAGSALNLLDKGASAINRRTGSEGGFFGEASKYMNDLAEGMRDKSDRYQGKGFTDLIKEGNYSGALGSAVLDATESAPLSLGIMATGGAGLVGAGALSASDKYDQLKRENPDMPAFNRYANSILTGVAESLSEVFGAGTLGKVIRSTLKAGGKKAAADLVKKNFLDKLANLESKHWITMPILSEGSEEAANALAEYVVDNATGVNRDDNIFETMINAAVPGAMGGAQFVPVVGAGKAYGWNQKRKVTNAYNDASKGIEGMFNDQEKAQFDETIHRFQRNGNINDINMFLFNVYAAKGLSEEERKAMLKYTEASMSYNNYVSYVNDRINAEVTKRMEDIDSNLNGDMGTVMRAVVNGDTENPVFITKGKLYSGELDDNMNPTIDYDKSDAVIYYRDSDGKIQQCDVRNVSYIESEKTRANLYAEIMDEVRGQILNEEESDINFAPGDDVVLPDGRKGNIQSRMEDGRFTVTLEDGTTVAMPYDQLVKPEEEAAQAEQQQQQSEEERIANRVYPTDKKNRIDYGQINDPQMYHDALIKEFGEDAIVAAESYMNNSKKDLEAADKKQDPIERLRAKREAKQKVDFFTQVYSMFPQTSDIDNTAQQPVDAQPGQTVANNENPAPEEPKIATPYEDRPVDDTVYDLLDGQMDIDEVNQFVDANKKEADKALKEIENNKPAMTTNRDEYLRQKSAWQALMDEAKRKSGYWDSVKANLQEGSMTDAERNQLSALEQNTPVNAEEFAARAIADGSIKLLRDDFKKETGSSNTEANKMFGIFASEAKGGVSIERAGEILTQMDQEAGTNFFDPNDPNAARNVIIDVLSLARTRGDLINYIRNLRDAQRRREEAAAYNDFAKYTTEAYDMTPEEYQAYEEDFNRNASFLTPEVRAEVDGMVYDSIKEEIADYNEVQQQLNNNNYGENEQGGVSEEGTGGREILPEQPSIPVKAGDRGVEGERITGNNGYNENGAAPEEAGGIKEGQVNSLSDEEISTIIDGMENLATDKPSVEYSKEEWDKRFKNPIETPVGRVRMGEHQFGKLHPDGNNNHQDRRSWIGIIYDTLTSPNIIVEQYDNVDGAERDYKYVFVKSFLTSSGESVTYFTSVTVKKGDMEVVITNHFKKYKDIRKLLKEGKLCFSSISPSGIQTEPNRASASVTTSETDNNPGVSEDKNNISPVDKQDLQAEIFNNDATQAENEDGNRPLLWGESAKETSPTNAASANVTTGKSSESGEQSGSASNQSDGQIKLKNGRSLYKATALDESANPSAEQPTNFVGSQSSESKSNINLFNKQAKQTELSENVLSSSDAEIKDSQKIAESEQEVDVNPTDAQKEAGNYKKGHLKLKGFDITIENTAGSVRSGVDRDGSRWENRMNNTYGYFKGTQGVDGDHIDVYLSNDMDNWSGDNVYVIDQYNPDGSFDEHKVMFGFDNKDEALSNFLANYSQGWGDSRKLDVTPISMDGFKKWVDSSHRKTKPFAEYSSVSKENEQNGTAMENSTTGNLPKSNNAPVYLYDDFGKDSSEYKTAVDRHNKLVNEIMTKKGEIKKKYIELLKNPIYAVFDTSSEKFIGISKTARGAYNIAINRDIEGFDVYYLDRKNKVCDWGYYFYRGFYDHDNSFDEKGSLKEEVIDSVVKYIDLLGKVPNTPLAPEKENSVSNNTTDTAGTPNMGKRNDTAIPQNTVSDSKDSVASDNNELNNQKSAAEPSDPIVKDGTTFKNNIAGGNAVARVIGSTVENGERKYLVRYATGLEEMDAKLLVGEETLPEDELRQRIEDGRFGTMDNQESTEKNEKPKERPKEKIEDVGEKIGGARKDIIRATADRIDINGETFSKIFPKFDFKKLIQSGLDPKLASGLKFIYDHSKESFKSKKRSRGEIAALNETRFIANYAKGYLLGDTSVDYSDKGWVFTDYGKELYQFNTELYNKLHEVLGDDMFDIDLGKYFIDVVPDSDGSKGKSSTVFYRDGKPIDVKYIVKVGSTQLFTKDEHDDAVKFFLDKVKSSVNYKKANPYKLAVYYFPRKKGSYYIGTKIGGKVVALTPEGNEYNYSYIDEHRAELQAAAERIASEMKDKAKSGENKKWKPEMNLGNMRDRVGMDYRGGRSVSAKELMDKFGFRGIEFGNYVTQKERQQYLNECYDAFMDMAGILGISPKAISIDGKLALAVGARGTGKASAHYEPAKHVINLTKAKSAGTLAHEWWHAMDFHFGRKSSSTPSTDNRFDEETRTEVRKAIESLMGKIQDSDYYKRSRLLDSRIGWKDYYSTNTELAARAFQDYITKRLIDKGQINDFLSHYTLAGDWNGKMETYPYPIESEADWIRASFDNLFSIIEEKEVDGNTVLYQKADIARSVSEDEANLRDALVDRLRQSGIDVIDNAEEGQKVLDEANAPARMQAKRRALETVSVTSDEAHQPTVVSSADGAKILKRLDETKEKYENISSRINTFIGDIANALGARRAGSKSEYATFETKNGRVITIRLADHNATVSNFDRRGELDGISIVVSPKKSGGIMNDGDAHVVEYYYDAIKLRKADGKPLADIVRSIKQALHSGEFKDTTGIAERQEVNAGTRFFRTPSGEAYGYTVNGKIYIDPRIATSETPIHEYAHLWASALRSSNQEEWKNVVDLMKGTPVWEEIRRNYPEFTTDDEIADEVLAQYSGRRGAEKLREAMKKASETKGGLIEKANAVAAIQNVKDALNRFWRKVADFFGVHFTTAEEVADKVLIDLLNGVNPTVLATKKRQLDKINKENPMLDDYHTGIRSIDDILTFREAVEQARREGDEGGWETLSAYPDVSNETLERAIESGKITVYSSHPITDGVFITPSRMQAEEYAGGGRVYQKEVNVDDVAWITTDEGQLAKVKGGKLPLRLQKDQEIDEIISRAKADGTYMKAPNGKPSNLTSRQWAQVRTKAFKDWFGDWELSYKKLNIVLADENHGFNSFTEAKEWAKDNIVRTLSNEDTGGKGEIRISSSAVSKFLSESSVVKSDSKDVHLSVLKYLPDVIRESVDAEQHPDYRKGDSGKRSVENGINENVTIHRLYSAVDINKKIYRIKVTLKEDRTNNDPKKAYSYEATKIELLDGQNEEAVTSSRNSNNSISAAKLLNGVDKSYGNGEKLLDFSKVVDENGEPMVVYHGTDKDIASFEMNDGSMGRGVYFTSNWDEAAEYAMDKQGVENIDDVDESKIYECFVNVRDNNQITHSRFSKDDIEVLVTDPTQIKSTTGNIGTFDGANPDIRYREGEQTSPDTNRQRMRDEAQNMGKSLGVEVRIVEDGSTLPGKRGKAKGFFDRADNSVTVVIGNHKSIGDIQATVLHEIVGHYGLRRMFGERFDDMMDTVYRTLDKATRGKIADVALRLYRGDVRVATEEYLASIAERGVERPGVWSRIKSAIKEFFRSMGIDLRMSDEDIAYMLWKSKNRLKDGDSIPAVIDKIAKDQDMREGLLYRDGLGFGSLLHTPKADRKGVSELAHDFMEKIRSGNPFTHETYIRLREGYQDRMIRVREFQKQVTDETGHKVEDFEDFYTFENQAHSRAQQDIEDFIREKMEPVWKLHDEIARAINKPAGESTHAIETYMMIKHGLERNAEMRKREIDNLTKNGQNPSQNDIDKINAKDFSGLTAISEEITGNPGMDEQACEKWAADFESKYNTDPLWDAIRKATGATLDKLLNTGQISKELYNQIKGMYKYYIPLKEWAGVRATDMYDYSDSDQDIVSNPLQKAKGRKTRAGNILANVMTDYESATMLGYKNLSRQRLLNLARNSGSSMMSVSEQWYTRGFDANGNEIWEPAAATGFTEDPAHNAQVIQDFNDNMRTLQKSGDAMLHKDVLRLGVPVKKWQERQHTVRVKEAGRDILIYFNGDPRVAQAINGQNNVKLDNAILRVANRLRKWMMLNYTARNINFILRNFIRDTFYVNTMNFVKYGAGFEAKYLINFPRAFKEIWNAEFKGKNVPEYESFRKNGGMTGYVEVMGYDRYKKEIEKLVKRSEGRNFHVRDFFHAIGAYIERFNSVIENCSRYSVYKTAKQSGMSELKAIEAAKEASVNFNRRGSGQMGAVWAQNAYFFFNASIQGTQNFASAAKNNPGRAAIALGFWVALGYTMRMIGAALSGGDDDDYDNLPDYIRQNNIVIPAGDGKYLMLPLSVEIRALFGLGDMMGQASLGR